MREIFELVMKANRLKEIKRSGWNKDKEKDGRRYFCKVDNPESSADHSWSTMLLLVLIALYKSENGDIDWEDLCKSMIMCTIHDIPEYVRGDPMTPFMSESEVLAKEKDEMEVFTEIISNLPNHVKTLLTSLMEEFLARKTQRAHNLKDSDYIDPILQGLLYHRVAGNVLNVSEFVETNLPRIKNESLAKALKSFLSDQDYT